MNDGVVQAEAVEQPVPDQTREVLVDQASA
jgi:hypothetical protein